MAADERQQPFETPRRTAILVSLLVGVATAIIGLPSVAVGQLVSKELREEAQGVEVTEKLGERIPMRLEFTDAAGSVQPLAKWFGTEKPVVLVLGYYRCPVVCPIIFNLLTESLRELDYTVGEDFNVVVVSVDPQETPTHAEAEKTKQLAAYGRVGEDISDGYAFLTTRDEDAIRELTDAAGYGYKLLDNGEYSHPVVLCFLSPDGVITRYIYGFDYPVKQVKLSLLDASEGRIAESLGDRLLHFCFRFDPNAGEYSLAAMQVMRLAGVLTIIGLGVFLGLMFASDRVRNARRLRAASGQDDHDAAGGESGRESSAAGVVAEQLSGQGAGPSGARARVVPAGGGT